MSRDPDDLTLPRNIYQTAEVENDSEDTAIIIPENATNSDEDTELETESEMDSESEWELETEFESDQESIDYESYYPFNSIEY